MQDVNKNNRTKEDAINKVREILSKDKRFDDAKVEIIFIDKQAQGG